MIDSQPSTVDPQPSWGPEPVVSLVIVAHNEASVIQAKLENVLSLDYPADRLEVLLASDGSTDDTVEIARRFGDDRVRVMPFPRGGKIATLNAAVLHATGEVLVFTDANSMFRSDALRCLLRPLADPQVGGVAGNQVYSKESRPRAESGERRAGTGRASRVQRPEQAGGRDARLARDSQLGSAIGPRLSTLDSGLLSALRSPLSAVSSPVSAAGERTYWGLDRLLKQFESRAGNTISATGAIYAIRRRLFRPVPPGVTDDFFISTSVIAQGYRLVFAHDAVAVEPVADSGRREFSRKVRVMTRGFRSLIEQRQLMNPLRYRFYSVQLFSHKLLRRLMLFPLATLLIVSPLLWQAGTAYRIATLLQTAFYSCALMGLLACRMRKFGDSFSRRPMGGAPPRPTFGRCPPAAQRENRWRLTEIIEIWRSGLRAVSRLRVALTIPYYFCMVNTAAAVAVFNTLSGRRIERWQTGREQQGETAARPRHGPRIATDEYPRAFTRG